MEYTLDSSIIASRLKDLREERGLSLNKLADKLPPIGDKSISAEILRKYECYQNKKKESPANIGMSARVLHTLADFYGVSTDYILGRTDIKSPDMSIEAIVEYTGLTEESIIYLHQLKSRDSTKILLNDTAAILAHDFIFKSKSNPAHYELEREMFDKMLGRAPEEPAKRKRQALISAKRECQKYVEGVIDALRKRPVYTLNAINVLLSNNDYLHLLEEIGKFISVDPEDLNDRYPTYVGQTSLHYTAPQDLTDDYIALKLERRLGTITEKLKQLREIAVSPTE